MLNKVLALFKEEEGQGMTEYGLVLGVIAVAVIAVMVLFRDEILKVYNEALGVLKSRPSPAPTPAP